MIFDALKQREVDAIPGRSREEWDMYTANITDEEEAEIINWISEKFEVVANRNERVQPSGWLGSGFDWLDTPLFPIYRECCNHMAFATDEEQQAKAGQIFGLYVSLTLSEHRPETWYFVKGEEYEAHGVPINSRIYFLPG